MLAEKLKFVFKATYKSLRVASDLKFKLGCVMSGYILPQEFEPKKSKSKRTCKEKIDQKMKSKLSIPREYFYLNLVRHAPKF